MQADLRTNLEKFKHGSYYIKSLLNLVKLFVRVCLVKKEVNVSALPLRVASEIGDTASTIVPVQMEVEVVPKHSLPDGVVRYRYFQLDLSALGLPQAVVVGQLLPGLAHLHAMTERFIAVDSVS